MRRPDPWPVLDTFVEGDYKVFRLLRERARSPRTGVCLDVYVLKTRDWINVIPITPDRRMVLVRQYRHGIKELTLEIPGGLVDPNEAPESAARRELLEETGYASQRLIHLGSVQAQPAIQDNTCHTYLALDAVPTTMPEPDEGEDLQVVTVSLEEVETRIRSGEIAHGLVLAAMYWFETWRRDNPGAL